MLTDFQKQKLKNYFDIFDIDNNNVLEKNDFERIVNDVAKTNGWTSDSAEYKNLYHKFVETRWKTLQKQADTNADQKVSLEEYYQYIEKLLNNPKLYQTEVIDVTQSMFDSFDKNGDGQLSLEEYKLMFKSIRVDESFANLIFQKIDLNQDNYISRSEHKTLIDQFFKSKDPEAPGNCFFGPLK